MHAKTLFSILLLGLNINQAEATSILSSESFMDINRYSISHYAARPSMARNDQYAGLTRGALFGEDGAWMTYSGIEAGYTRSLVRDIDAFFRLDNPIISGNGQGFFTLSAAYSAAVDDAYSRDAAYVGHDPVRAKSRPLTDLTISPASGEPEQYQTAGSQSAIVMDDGDLNFFSTDAGSKAYVFSVPLPAAAWIFLTGLMSVMGFSRKPYLLA